MAEVLGLVASVVAVIQLTDTVGKTASKYIHTVKGTRSTLQPLVYKLQGLKDILTAIQTQLEIKSSDHPKYLALQHLKQPLEVCQVIMIKLEARLNSIKVVGNYVVGSILDRSMTNYLNQLDDLTNLLRLALATDSLASVQAVETELKSLRLGTSEHSQRLQDELEAHHEDLLDWRKEADVARETAFQEKIIAWLVLADPEYNHRVACRRQEPGTGSWLFESPEYTDWETGHNLNLWLSAMG